MADPILDTSDIDQYLGKAITSSRIREPKDVFNLDSQRLADQGAEGAKKAAKYVHDWKVIPPQSCSGCHR